VGYVVLIAKTCVQPSFQSRDVLFNRRVNWPVGITDKFLALPISQSIFNGQINIKITTRDYGGWGLKTELRYKFKVLSLSEELLKFLQPGSLIKNDWRPKSLLIQCPVLLEMISSQFQ
jgi:hypothetical protein